MRNKYREKKVHLNAFDTKEKDSLLLDHIGSNLSVLTSWVVIRQIEFCHFESCQLSFSRNRGNYRIQIDFKRIRVCSSWEILIAEGKPIRFVSHAWTSGGIWSNGEVMAGGYWNLVLSVHIPCLLLTVLNLQNLWPVEVLVPVCAVWVCQLVACCDTVWVIGVVRKPR